MKTIIVVLFILNAAAFIWLSNLSEDSTIHRNLLAELAEEADKKYGPLEQLNVDIGQMYMRKYEKQKIAINWTRGLLLANLCVLFLGGLIIDIQRITEPAASL